MRWLQVLVFMTVPLTNGFTAATTFIVLPVGTENRDGNTSAWEPFAIGTNSMRYQQVFTPLGFTAYFGDTESFLIDGIFFRVDRTNANGSFINILDFAINLSTTIRGPDELSTLFAENTGVDDMSVLARTNLFIRADFPGSYSTRIHFTQPFYYDTLAGNLLLDVRYYSSPGPGQLQPLDAVNFPNDDTSRVWANSVNATSGTADSLGLVLGLDVTPIPEPASLTLLICGVAVIGFDIRRQTHRKP